ncbi:30S ribosomal protein S1 [Candidatus Blochmanniella vafra str. BVAF]|uniref:30S ribosomal protein S1 n=1 Tax=Blochmanniella vafra (strain BVAF) TaxID=859654 RepID=E8Q682_BLOVB|nr:30S ribosomal protein S1 [Candidatus Blochmannia vafer]ADV33776.1 30S ribosomal protein S1 [Candidatus Blochmannia vafer str. BVAF]
MIESFAQLFKESLQKIKTKPGSVIQGTVISIFKDVVWVDAGLKSESAIPIDQFYNSKGELEIAIGDSVDVILDAIEDGFGETVLSREKAKRLESWLFLEQAYRDTTTVEGIINGKVKGGFTVELNGIRAFLPGSLVDVRPIKDTLDLEGQICEFKVIKLDYKRNNVVVSRRAAIESENSAERDQLLNKLHEGVVLKGLVKNLTDYGAFIDLGGIDGLLHITDISWKRVKHPSDVINIGDSITVKVLKFDKERIRVSLGLKQLQDDPWASVIHNYKEGDKLVGKVTNLTDYGCFIEIKGGVEGLVHISEMDWTNKNIQPSKVVAIGDLIEVIVLDIDKDRRRISLGLKQCKINPWQKFSEMYTRGDKVSGKIKSVTDFGIFIGLEGGIDGLVHLSDISWDMVNEESINKYKKGDEIEAVVLQVDIERERISLSIKQLTEDPLNSFLSIHKKSSIVSGSIVSIDHNKKKLIVKLDGTNSIMGHLNLEDHSYNEPNLLIVKQEFIKKLPYLKIGNAIQAKLDSIDRKNRIINLILYHSCENQKKSEVDMINNEKHFEKDKNNFSSVMIEAFKAATKHD